MAILDPAGLLVLTIFCFTLLMYYYFTFLHSTCAKQINKFPGPPPLPMIGCNYFALFSFCDGTKGIQMLFDIYGETTKFWICNAPYLVTKDLELVEKVFYNQECLGKAETNKYADFFAGTGIVNATARKWKVDRKVLAPSVNSTLFSGFLESFNKNAGSFVEIMETKFLLGSRESHDLFNDIGRCSLKIAMETLMDFQLDIQGEAEIVLDAMLTCSRLWFIKMRKPWINNSMMAEILGYAKIQRDNMATVRNMFARIDTKMRKSFEISGNEERSKRFVDLLYSNDFSDDDRFFHFTNMVIAAFETTSTSLNHILYLLALNPHVQTKLRKELNTVYQGEDRDITMDDLSQMRYLELVIRESMRMFPPVPGLGRYINCDITLDNGMIVPKGSNILIPLWHVHHDPRNYPDPEKFIPERFLPENSNTRNPSSFLSFSVGPRGCLGQKFAMMEMKAILSKVLSKFEVRTDKRVEDVTFEYNIGMQAVGGLPVTLARRNEGTI